MSRESNLDRSVNFDKEIELPILNQDMLYVLESRSVVCIIHLNGWSERKNGLESLEPSIKNKWLVIHIPADKLMTHQRVHYDSFCSCFLHLYLMYNVMAATIGPIIYTSLSDISTDNWGIT